MTLDSEAGLRRGVLLVGRLSRFLAAAPKGTGTCLNQWSCSSAAYCAIRLGHHDRVHSYLEGQDYNMLRCLETRFCRGLNFCVTNIDS
eukprot:2730542-Amphidinium_carterae.2